MSHLKLLLLSLLPIASFAQRPGGAWGGGIGVGNGLALHVAHTSGKLLILGRGRYKIWGPDVGPGSLFSFTQSLDTHSQQAEAAVLTGSSLPLGRAAVYGVAGLGYVTGRQLGEYRYSIRTNGFLGEATHYYAYRDYQALGLPLEAGILLPAKKRPAGLGLVFQANLNPERSVYCVLLTCWFGRVGTATTIPTK